MNNAESRPQNNADATAKPQTEQPTTSTSTTSETPQGETIMNTTQDQMHVAAAAEAGHAADGNENAHGKSTLENLEAQSPQLEQEVEFEEEEDNEGDIRRAMDHFMRRDLLAFTERAFAETSPHTPLIPSQHHALVAAKLQACVDGTCKRLIICMPPRSLKSYFASVALPAWLLGRQPGKSIICASYGQELADKHARDCRTVMLSPFFKRLFPKCALSPKRMAVNDFDTTEHGGRMATSVGGVLTGRGADALIIDDPLKPQDAFSESLRRAVNEWYTHTLLSRLNSKGDGLIIIVMQRVHQDDLVNHVRSLGEWEVLSLPAVAEEEETIPYSTPYEQGVFHRLPGEVLEPARDSRETFERIRKEIGSYPYNAQYQQQPEPEGGADIKRDWFQWYDPLGPVDKTYIVQSWDTASKSGQLNDYSVCTTWAVCRERRYLVDVYRQRLEYPELKRAVRAQRDKYRPAEILIEDASAGIQLIQDLKREGVGGIKPVKPRPRLDKRMRLNLVLAEIEAGEVFLPTRAPWLQDYLKELLTFPGCKHDDQVDSTTQALEHLKNSNLEKWTRLADGFEQLGNHLIYGIPLGIRSYR